jgi:ABC-type multidrug transport system ATPase subunit
LNALNYRNSDSLRIEGEVKLNGNKVDWDKITRYSGYVQQDDLFIGTMTVREHITFIVIITYV